MTGLGDLKAIAARMGKQKDDYMDEEEVMFWDLVEIRSGNIIESLTSLKKTMRGESDD